MASIQEVVRREVFNAVVEERDYQDNKWGEDKQQSFPGFLLVMRKELEEAELAWLKNHTHSRNTALEEVVQVVATGIACLEKYGTQGCPGSTDDEVPYDGPEPGYLER